MSYVFPSIEERAENTSLDKACQFIERLLVARAPIAPELPATTEEGARRMSREAEDRLMTRFCEVINDMLDGSFEERYGLLEPWASTHDRLMARIKKTTKEDQQFTYTSTQHTTCAGCLKDKHTPLRIDHMGGYVCLTCIDKALVNSAPREKGDNWYEEGAFPPEGSQVRVYLNSLDPEHYEIVKIRAYGVNNCIAEAEDGEEIVFPFNDNTFKPLSEEDL